MDQRHLAHDRHQPRGEVLRHHESGHSRAGRGDRPLATLRRARQPAADGDRMTGRFARFVRRLGNTVRPAREDASLDREIASHLALLEEEYQRRGVPAADARRAARLALGGVEQTKELHRDARSWRWIDNARRDAVYAVRMLRRHPVTTAAAALSLAVGIGINAAVFSVVDWV